MKPTPSVKTEHDFSSPSGGAHGRVPLMLPEEIHIEGRGLYRSFQIGKKVIEVLRGVDLQVRRARDSFCVVPPVRAETSLLLHLGGA